MQYSGGKRKMAGHIGRVLREYFPSETHLLSPFLGMGAIELRWMHTRRGTCLGSDADFRLINLWHHVRFDAGEVARVARDLLPIGRDTFEQWRVELSSPGCTEIQHAAKFYIIHNCQIVHGENWWENHAVKWNRPHVYKSFLSRLRQFKAPRLEVVCEDFRSFLHKHDGVVYADPPYYSERGEMEKVYDGGVTAVFKERDHEALADMLTTRTGWVLSNYNHPWVRERYAGYHQFEVDMTYGSRNLHHNKEKARELLVVCPA